MKLGVSVFSFLFRWDGISPIENDFEWKSQRNNHLKMGFPLPAIIYLAENLFGPKIPVLSFFYWSGIILFSSDLFLLTFFRSLIGNPSFPFFSFLEIHWEICNCFCVCLFLFNVSGFVPCFAFFFFILPRSAKGKCGGIWCVIIFSYFLTLFVTILITD